MTAYKIMKARHALEEKKREIQKEKIKLQSEKTEYSKWLREDARSELFEEKLFNAIERACVLGNPPTIKFEDLRLNLGETSEESCKTDRFFMDFSDIINENDMSLKTAVDTFKKNYIKKVLDMTKNNQTKAAKVLDIQRTYLARLLNELGIRE